MKYFLASGFSLLEVLIAILIFSLALLGLDLLGAAALHQSVENYHKSIELQKQHNLTVKRRLL